MRTRSHTYAALALVAVAALALAALATTAESHQGHPQKKLFPERWHYQVQNGDYAAWMTLSTSDVWLECDNNENQCGTKWKTPFDDAFADWNSQPDTVTFAITNGVQNEFFDLNVYVEDEALGDPTLLGIAPTFDENDFPCFDPSCEVAYGLIIIGDDAHNGPYAGPLDRRATLGHEAGHIIQLAHESTNEDETQLYECGMDDTGPIPHSIMSYDCIDPVAVDGAGEFFVQPWDVCGINHAYYDPAFDFTGCDGTLNTPSPTPSPSPSETPTATPTPTPSQTSTQTATTTPTGGNSVSPTSSATPSTTPVGIARVWGDINCGGGSNPVDSLLVLRFDAGLSTSAPAGCPLPGTLLYVPFQCCGTAWGNVDCLSGVNPVDSLKILLADAGTPTDQPAGCPEIGDTVVLTEDLLIPDKPTFTAGAAQ
ncbi:MAG: hypothetical protein WD904_12570 [Dehalococcoidia bacterium]